MLDQWIEIYREPDENRFNELVALLEQNNIPQKTDVYNRGTKMAAYGGSHAMTRIGYVNPATVSAAFEEPEDIQRLYCIKIRKRDFPQVHELMGQSKD